MKSQDWHTSKCLTNVLDTGGASQDTWNIEHAHVNTTGTNKDLMFYKGVKENVSMVYIVAEHLQLFWKLIP